jgi:hypothetical protein
MIYLDHNGKPQMETSSLFAGFSSYIFTHEVTHRFMSFAIPEGYAKIPCVDAGEETVLMRLPLCEPTNTSTWRQVPFYSISIGYARWLTMDTCSLTRPADPIPCVWHTVQKRRDTRRTDRARLRPKQTAADPLAKTVLRVGNRQLLRRYYEEAFKDLQQINCRVVAKSYVKLVEPRKQTKHPYNGSRLISGIQQFRDPQLTKPEWWPVNVVHREPDHLLKTGQ